MKIEKYSYGKSFLLPDGNWDKYEITVSLEDAEDPDKARQLAKEMVDDFFKRNNPAAPTIGPTGELPVIQVQKETAEDRRIAQFVKDIEGCMTLKTLGVYYNMREDSILIKNAYDKRSEFLRSSQNIPVIKTHK